MPRKQLDLSVVTAPENNQAGADKARLPRQCHVFSSFKNEHVMFIFVIAYSVLFYSRIVNLHA